MIGHRIDYNGVGVRRGQRDIPSKNWPKYPPPGLVSNKKLLQDCLKAHSSKLETFRSISVPNFLYYLILGHVNWSERCGVLCLYCIIFNQGNVYWSQRGFENNVFYDFIVVFFYHSSTLINRDSFTVLPFMNYPQLWNLFIYKQLPKMHVSVHFLPFWKSCKILKNLTFLSFSNCPPTFRLSMELFMSSLAIRRPSFKYSGVLMWNMLRNV